MARHRPSAWRGRPAGAVCGIGCASRLGGAIQTAADSSREHAAAAFHVTYFLPMHCLPTGEKRPNPTRSVIYCRKDGWKYFPHWNPRVLLAGRVAARIRSGEKCSKLGLRGDAMFEVISWRTMRYRSEEHTSELQSLRHLVCRL